MNSSGNPGTDFYIKGLDSLLCACGGTKKRRQSFCRECYFALPKRIRDKLYLGIGEGYEAVYERAIDLLGIPRP